MDEQRIGGKWNRESAIPESEDKGSWYYGEDFEPSHAKGFTALALWIVLMLVGVPPLWQLWQAGRERFYRDAEGQCWEVVWKRSAEAAPAPESSVESGKECCSEIDWTQDSRRIPNLCKPQEDVISDEQGGYWKSTTLAREEPHTKSIAIKDLRIQDEYEPWHRPPEPQDGPGAYVVGHHDSLQDSWFVREEITKEALWYECIGARRRP